MKGAEKPSIQKKNGQVVAKSGKAGRPRKYVYPNGEPMSKADISMYKAWEKTYENRENFIDFVK